MKTESVLLPTAHPKVFEQYEFKNWLITITDKYCDGNLTGFATPTKYAHILNMDNYESIDEIAEDNNIKGSIDEDGDYGYGDFCYFVAEPDDIVVSFLAKVNTQSASCVLDYVVNQIIKLFDINHSETIVLKQVYKKAIIPKVGKRKTGFLHQAWASLVKDRDKKCMECGSVYDLHAHHIKQYKDYPELRSDVNNGITLCGSCHRNWHHNNGR